MPQARPGNPKGRGPIPGSFSFPAAPALTGGHRRSHNRPVNARDLVSRLDEYLRIDAYQGEDFAIIVDFSHEAGVPIEHYAAPDFLRRFNGLMLDNTDDIRQVFTLVFPADDVLAEVERLADGEGALIFTHHPMDMETGGRGLLPIPASRLDRLRSARISLYAAHVPLDCHPATSTSRALARAVGVPAEGTFAAYHGGQAGVHGHVEPGALVDFSERVRLACALDRVETKDAGRPVRHVAVVAGGAAYPGLMEEALSLGCDTYLTGDFRIRHSGPWAEEHRPQFDAFVDGVELNLIGASHYATEAIVLREDIVDFFRDLGLPAQFVPQSDPWR